MLTLVLITFSACVYAQAPASQIYYGDSYNFANMTFGFFGTETTRGESYWKSESASDVWVGAFYEEPIVPLGWLVVGFSPFVGPVYLMGSNDNVTFSQISSIGRAQFDESYGANVCGGMFGCWYQTIVGTSSYAFFRYQVEHGDYDYAVTLWGQNGLCASAFESYPAEDTYAFVACPPGVSIGFVLFAAFGTLPKGSCGSYTPGICFLDITSYAASLCIGNNSCSIPINYKLYSNIYGGDPCPSWQKSVTIEVQCSLPPPPFALPPVPSASPPPPPASPPPPSASPPPPSASLSTGAWGYQGAFYDAGIHTITQSANVQAFGFVCYSNACINCDPQPNNVCLPHSMSLVNCQIWAESHGFDTIAMNGGICTGCKQCLFYGAGRVPGCIPGSYCGNNVNLVYTTFGAPPAALPPPYASPSSSVPPIAAAAGYMTNTFSSSSFGPSNVDLQNARFDLPRRSPGMQWWFKQPYYQSSNVGDACSSVPDCVQFNSDGSVTLTSTTLHAFRVMPGQQTQGVGFGGGAYFEAVISFDGAQVDRVSKLPALEGNSWPAFWANSLEFMDYSVNSRFADYVGSDTYGLGGNTVVRYIEADVMEAYNIADTRDYISTMHDWSHDQGQRHIQATLTLPLGVQFTQKNTYGLLWTPATDTTAGTLISYFNGVKGSYFQEWSKYDCSQSGADYSGNPEYSSFSILDCQHLALMLDTGADTPMTVYSVNVWQVGVSKNVYPASAQ